MEHVVESVVHSGLEGEVVLHKRGKYQKNKLSKKKSQSKTRKNVKKQGKFSKQENGEPGSCAQLIQGTYEYAGGCFGSFFRSTISCDGERCMYSEYQIKINACDENDELFVPNYCSLGGEFKILEELNQVESSSCKLELIPLIASDTCNFGNGVPTHLKAYFLEGGDAMQLFFSRDDGKTFYNQRDPRMAIKVSNNTNHGRACDSAKDGAKVYSELPLSTSTGEIPSVLSDCEQEPGMGGDGGGMGGDGGGGMGGMGGDGGGGMGGDGGGGMGGDGGGMGGDGGGMGGDGGGMGGDGGGMDGDGMGGGGDDDMDDGGMGGMMGMRQWFNRNPRRKLPHIQNEVPQATALPSFYSINPSLSAHNWEKFSFDDFWEVLECTNVPADSRPIHDMSTWKYVRQAYEDVVGHERSSIRKAWSGIDAMDKKPSVAEESVFLHVDVVPGKGRGILASRDIKAGEYLWSDMYMAAFYHVKDINRFLAVLPTQLACDTMLWEYDHDKNSKDYFFTVNLDMSSFCNNGGSAEKNVVWDYGLVVNDFFADRDISIGEEILCNYGYEQVK
eukprot:CAMPEP_0194298328 /NCGR_PEP_ID=MMETSP0169-20130528/60104_1 /TAXON_ID=218684 /ORGANISM="Corethron pennatum, Strain L29A3" /LENGTH=557 /DNA_ID=CAMNT_0039048303 /DNA_START=181 /DNA_END=1854 /DNA_ORIENTATION=+